MNTSILDTQPDSPLKLFEIDIKKLQTPSKETPPISSQLTANFPVPIEISRIAQGGIAYFQGGLMNEGISSWYAFDIERHLFIAVLASHRDSPRYKSAIDNTVHNQLLRYTDAAGYPRLEFITILTATPEQVREFSCLANKLLTCKSEAILRPVALGIIRKNFSLVRDGQIVTLSAGQNAWELEGSLENFIHQALQPIILE